MDTLCLANVWCEGVAILVYFVGITWLKTTGCCEGKFSNYIELLLELLTPLNLSFLGWRYFRAW